MISLDVSEAVRGVNIGQHIDPPCEGWGAPLIRVAVYTPARVGDPVGPILDGVEFYIFERRWWRDGAGPMFPRWERTA